jgi:WD40 repeat protein
LPKPSGRRRLLRVAALLVAVGSATWMVVQAVRGHFDLWAPLGVAIAVLSLTGDAAERRRQRLLSDPSTDELATRLADILDSKCRAEVSDRRLLEDSGLLPVAWTEVQATAPDVRVDKTRPDQRIRMGFEEAALRLAELFRNDPAGSLVVLGQPGAGKSVLALTLQVGLLKTRTGQPSDERVPVLVSVASWDPLGATLDDFLVDALARAHYGGNPDHPRSLLGAGRLLPILDGLDEIPEVSRGAAVTAVNEAINPRRRPLVITCRVVEYEDLIHSGAPPLRRATVIRVLPVRPRDAIAYLKATASTDTSAWADVFTEIGRPGSPIAEAYSTPLMVAIARDVYGRLGRDPREQLGDSLDSRLAVENNLLDQLVDAAYPPLDGPQPRQRPAMRWPKEEASRHLTFLARYLYDAQERDLRWWDLANRLPMFGSVVLLGTVVGLLMMVATQVCFAVGSNGTADADLAAGALGLVFLILIMTTWLAESAPPGRLPSRPFSPSTIRTAFAVAPKLGTLMWIPFAFGSAVLITVIDRWSASGASLFLLLMGLVSVLLVAITVTLAVGRWLLAAPAAARLDSPRAVLRQDRTSTLVSSAVSGLVFALLLTPLTLTVVVLGSAVYGWTTGGVGWLRDARLSDLVQARLADVVPGYFATWPIAVWLLVVMPGLLAGTYVLMSRAWFRFQIARAVLAGAGALPWRLLGFIEDACRHELLRQSGGAYQFRHLRLQERLADDQSPVYLAELEARRARERRQRRILVPALVIAFFATLAVPLTAAPRDGADTVLRLPYGTTADELLVSPDGSNLAAMSFDGIRLWRLDEEIEPDDQPYFIETAGNDVENYFNPNGLLFFVHDRDPATGSPETESEPRVRVWRWAGQGWEQLDKARPPRAVLLLNDGEQVGVLSATDGRANATLTVYAAAGGPGYPIPGRFADDLGETDPPEYDDGGLLVSLLGRRFVLTGQDDGSLRVWDIKDVGSEARVIAQPGGGPSEALVDPAGRHVLVRTRNGAKLFDVSLGTSTPLLYQEAGSKPQVYRETKSELHFDPTGTWLAGTSGTRENQSDDDRTVTVWNTADATRHSSWTLDEDVLGVEFLPGAPALLVETAEQESDNSTLRILPVGGGPASPPMAGVSDRALYRAWPDPVLVVARVRSDTSPGTRVDILCVTSGACGTPGTVKHSIEVPDELEELDRWAPRPGEAGQPPPIVARTKNMAWNSVTGQELGPGGQVEWARHRESLTGSVIAGWSEDRVTIYDAKTGARGQRLPGSLSGSTGPSFSIDGAFLAASAKDGAIQVWDLDNPGVFALNGHSGEVTALVWGRRPDLNVLISAGESDSTIRLWKLSSVTSRR